MMQNNSTPTFPSMPRRANEAVTSRLGRRFSGLLLAAGLATAGAVPATMLATVPAHAATFDNAGSESQLVSLVNSDRAANGKGPLVVNPTLSNIARSAPHSVCGSALHGRSQDMIDRGYFSHQIPPCSSYVWPVLSSYGVQYSTAGENIGWNNYDPASSVGQVNTAFMTSPEHKANILGNYNQVGVGAYMAPGQWGGYSGVIMYTEIFAMAPLPAPVYPPATATDSVGVVGSDDQLYGHQPSNGFTRLGGSLVGAPALVRTSAAPGGVLYVGTGMDHDLWVRSLSSGWQRLSANPVYCNDNPAMSVIGSTLHVVCQGGDAALWYASGTVTNGVLPTVGGWQSLGGQIVSGPAAGQLPGTSGPTFIANGTDGAVYATDLNSGWHAMGWRCIGHPALAGTASGTAYFACHGADGQLWTAGYSNGSWSGASPIGGSAVDGVGVSLTSTGADYYFQGVDNQVYEISKTATSQFQVAVVGGGVKHGVTSAP